MPLYDYKCCDCGVVKELYFSMADVREEGPECEACAGRTLRFYNPQAAAKGFVYTTLGHWMDVNKKSISRPKEKFWGNKMDE